MLAMSKAGPMQSWELQTQSRSPKRRAGIQLLEPSTLAGSWSQEPEPGFEPRYSKMGCEHLSQLSNHWAKCLPHKCDLSCREDKK